MIKFKKIFWGGNMFSKNTKKDLKKYLLYAVATALVGYPCVTFLTAVAFSLGKLSFSFFGFDMISDITSNSLSYNLHIGKLYFISMVCLFFVLAIVSLVVVYLKNKRQNTK